MTGMLIRQEIRRKTVRLSMAQLRELLRAIDAHLTQTRQKNLDEQLVFWHSQVSDARRALAERPQDAYAQDLLARTEISLNEQAAVVKERLLPRLDASLGAGRSVSVKGDVDDLLAQGNLEGAKSIRVDFGSNVVLNLDASSGLVITLSSDDEHWLSTVTAVVEMGIRGVSRWWSIFRRGTFVAAAWAFTVLAGLSYAGQNDHNTAVAAIMWWATIAALVLLTASGVSNLLVPAFRFTDAPQPLMTKTLKVVSAVAAFAVTTVAGSFLLKFLNLE
ncbi:hypothetical protein LVY72_13890 [Arthrobacter sp. I2-34]|uniref:Uncharacterized protein n=1 Tax=Arthrobacter hankyongi TaxID=2904801 RepID=A0ABS9L8J4_9MICC|nr:hypothetical protein [Arthrobacter hankyongi]MCG2622989.1 hypothetical protein [Arthrobacter hankyongi]